MLNLLKVKFWLHRQLTDSCLFWSTKSNEPLNFNHFSHLLLLCYGAWSIPNFYKWHPFTKKCVRRCGICIVVVAHEKLAHAAADSGFVVSIPRFTFCCVCFPFFIHHRLALHFHHPIGLFFPPAGNFTNPTHLTEKSRTDCKFCRLSVKQRADAYSSGAKGANKKNHCKHSSKQTRQQQQKCGYLLMLKWQPPPPPLPTCPLYSRVVWRVLLQPLAAHSSVSCVVPCEGGKNKNNSKAAATSLPLYGYFPLARTFTSVTP